MRETYATLADCISNTSPPWIYYFDLMIVHLIILDKHTGVSTVGIGELFILLILMAVL